MLSHPSLASAATATTTSKQQATYQAGTPIPSLSWTTPPPVAVQKASPAKSTSNSGQNPPYAMPNTKPDTQTAKSFLCQLPTIKSAAPQNKQPNETNTTAKLILSKYPQPEWPTPVTFDLRSDL